MDGWLVKYFKPSDTSSPLPHFISHQPVPILYTMQKILSRNSDGNSTPGVFEGIKAHGSIYRPVCACECVFRYHNSKIALSEGAPTSRKAQTALSLMDVCLNRAMVTQNTQPGFRLLTRKRWDHRGEPETLE